MLYSGQTLNRSYEMKINSKKSPIVWTDFHDKYFRKLKYKLTSKPVLAHLNEHFETNIVIDTTSQLDLDVIIQQKTIITKYTV